MIELNMAHCLYVEFIVAILHIGKVMKRVVLKVCY